MKYHRDPMEDTFRVVGFLIETTSVGKEGVQISGGQPLPLVVESAVVRLSDHCT